jgi:DNA mismatch repair protein MutS
VFLRRLVAGGASRSYGIQVAKLAGLPGPVIDRAKRILRNLEDGEFDSRGRPRLADGGDVDDQSEGDRQLALAIGGGSLSPAEQEVLGELAEVDANAITPMEALQLLERWATRIKDPASG